MESPFSMTNKTLRHQSMRAIGKMAFLKEKVDLLGINKKKKGHLYLMDIGMITALNSKERLWLMRN